MSLVSNQPPLDPSTATAGVFGLRSDLGALPADLWRLSSPPVLLPVPCDLAAEVPGPGHPVVIGAGGALAAWRYDCWMVSARDTDNGREVGVSVEPEMAIAGTPIPGDRPPRFWWLPSAQVWIERPADTATPPAAPEGPPVPDQPPVRALTRAVDADRVIGRYGWLAGPAGWLLVAAVSNIYAGALTSTTRARLGDDTATEPKMNVIGRREWWRWGIAGTVEPDAIAAVPAEAVWLE